MNDLATAEPTTHADNAATFKTAREAMENFIASRTHGDTIQTVFSTGLGLARIAGKLAGGKASVNDTNFTENVKKHAASIAEMATLASAGSENPNLPQDDKGVGKQTRLAVLRFAGYDLTKSNAILATAQRAIDAACQGLNVKEPIKGGYMLDRVCRVVLGVSESDIDVKKAIGLK